MPMCQMRRFPVASELSEESSNTYYPQYKHHNPEHSDAESVWTSGGLFGIGLFLVYVSEHLFGLRMHAIAHKNMPIMEK
jgi:hypothetical protein